MAMAIVSHPQSRANLLRELLRSDPAIRRTGAWLQGVEGTEDRLVVLVRHAGRTVRLERGPEWRGLPLDRLREGLTAQALRRMVVTPLVAGIRPSRRVAPLVAPTIRSIRLRHRRALPPGR